MPLTRTPKDDSRFLRGRQGDPLPRNPNAPAPQAPVPNHGLPGWEDLSHSGLLLDAARLAELASHTPAPLDGYTEDKLRRRATALLDGEAAESAEVSRFVAFVLDEVCGFDAATGVWQRGSNVPAAEGRRVVTGETVKPRHLWKGPRGARLPVFFDGAARLGIGRSRRAVGQALAWLRAGPQHLALLTNGRHLALVVRRAGFRRLLPVGRRGMVRAWRTGAAVGGIAHAAATEAVDAAGEGRPRRRCCRASATSARGRRSFPKCSASGRARRWRFSSKATARRLANAARTWNRRTSTALPAGWPCGWWWRCSRSPASCCRAATPCTTRATASKACGRGWPPKTRAALRSPRAMPRGSSAGAVPPGA